jgi:DNA replication and repair protein RecF
MRLSRLRGENFRAYSQFELQPHAKLNLIVGPNAAGKTSLLEALYLLGRAKSFRSPELNELAGRDGKRWTVYGEAGDSIGSRRQGAGWDEKGLQLRLDGETAKASAMARALPVQLIDPAGHRLVDEGPGYRRSYLDWGVFHVEPGFLALWQRYQRTLKQRNLALRQGASDSVVSAWNGEMAAAAEKVTVLREAHVERIGPVLSGMAEALLDLREVRCEFHRGWSEQMDFGDVLQKQLNQHRRLGTTSQGPHRAELKLWIGSQRAKGRISRGQQKLLVAALVLAQCAILVESGVSPPVVLVDDFGAELSTDYQQRLATALKRYDGQVFVSAFEIPNALNDVSRSVFHVEQGQVRDVETQ